MIYFDTAYLLKCYIKEVGWEEVRALAQQREMVACSAYGKMELHAALHRKLREGEVTGRQLTTIFGQLELDESQRLWTWLSLTEFIMVSVVDSFRTLPDRVFVRTADAVHLVTAKTNGFSDIYSNDTHLLAAAPHFGLEGKNIIDPV
jgi:predicted nucleic acid-binding protein